MDPSQCCLSRTYVITAYNDRASALVNSARNPNFQGTSQHPRCLSPSFRFLLLRKVKSTHQAASAADEIAFTVGTCREAYCISGGKRSRQQPRSHCPTSSRSMEFTMSIHQNPSDAIAIKMVENSD